MRRQPNSSGSVNPQKTSGYVLGWGVFNLNKQGLFQQGFTGCLLFLLGYSIAQGLGWLNTPYVHAETTLDGFELVQDEHQQLEVRVRSDKPPDVVTETKDGTVSIILKSTKLSSKQKSMPVVLDNKGQYIGRAVPSEDGTVKIILPNMHTGQVKLKVNYVPSTQGLTTLPQPPTPKKHQGWEAMETSPHTMAEHSEAPTLPRIQRYDGLSSSSGKQKHTETKTRRNITSSRHSQAFRWFWDKNPPRKASYHPKLPSTTKHRSTAVTTKVSTTKKAVPTTAQLLLASTAGVAHLSTTQASITSKITKAMPHQILRQMLESEYRPHLALAVTPEHLGTWHWINTHWDTLAHGDLGFLWHIKPKVLSLGHASLNTRVLRPYRLTSLKEPLHEVVSGSQALVTSEAAWVSQSRPLGMMMVMPMIQSPYALMEDDILAWSEGKETPLTLVATEASATSSGPTQGVSAPSSSATVIQTDTASKTLQSQQSSSTIASLASPEGPVKVMAQPSQDPVQEMLKGMGIPESGLGYIGFYGAVVLVGVLLLGAFARMFLGGWASRARGALGMQGLPAEKSPVGLKWTTSQEASISEEAFAQAHPFWQEIASSHTDNPAMAPEVMPHTLQQVPSEATEQFQSYVAPQPYETQTRPNEMQAPSQDVALQWDTEQLGQGFIGQETASEDFSMLMAPGFDTSMVHHHSEASHVNLQAEATPSLQQLEAELTHYTQAYNPSYETTLAPQASHEPSAIETLTPSPHETHPLEQEPFMPPSHLEANGTIPLQVPPLYPTNDIEAFETSHPIEAPYPHQETWGLAPVNAWIFQETIGAGLKPAMANPQGSTETSQSIPSASVHAPSHASASSTHQTMMNRWIRRMLPSSHVS
ncbi:MAG: hypothetical protein ACKO37_00935 [Vampirovibrionales bacterium]